LGCTAAILVARRHTVVAVPDPVFTVIGRPVPRVEGVDKVSGSARYTADYNPPGMLWARNVRSPLPHARIVSIDATRALALPGVRAVLTAADMPDVHTGRNIRDVPLLCADVVRFIGDKVAVVVADDRATAEEGIELVDIQYEELPAVFDASEAMTGDAPVLHPDPRAYEGFPEDVPDDIPNVCGYATWDRGDLEVGFAEADVIVENTYTTPLAHQGYLENSAWLIDITHDEAGAERVEVWGSNKTPFTMKAEIARLIDRPKEDVLVHAVSIGADFGGKSSVGDLVAGYYLARKLERPIKFVNTAQEDLTAASPKHEIVTTLRTGVTRGGKITAHDAKVVINRGAYTGLNTSGNGLLGGAGRAGNFYEIPNLRIEAFAVYTNRVPCGYMRAPGSPQVLFAVESHMNQIAKQLGMDPVELRRRNVPSHSPSGAESVADRVINAGTEAFGWVDPTPLTAADRARGPHTVVGRGIALIDRNQGAGEGSSDITVNPDGTVTAVSAAPDNGTGAATVVAAVVAEDFGIPLDRVHLIRGNTDALPIDAESGGSRMTNSVGTVALAAIQQVKEQLSPLAARALGAPSVEWVRQQTGADGALRPGGWQSPDGRFISLEAVASELVQEGAPEAHAQVTMRAPRSPDPGICAQLAQVTVDLETGEVKLERLVTAQDVGTIINELGHQGQISGSVIQGVGHALMEELLVEDGRVTTPNFNEYKMPTMVDIPELTTVNVPEPGMGPFAAKSIGEIPTIPTGGAIASAVADAIGVPVLALPVTAERVLAAIRARDAAAS
jgi:CO/xanthine dehydrogenase Mo-binding subunit